MYSKQLPLGKTNALKLLPRRGRGGIKKQSAIGAAENKNPEPLHARAHDVKASVEAGVSPAKARAADIRLP